MTMNTWWVLTDIVSQRVLDFAATLFACVPVLNWVCCLFSHLITFSSPCCFMCFGLRRVVIFVFKKCVPFLHLPIKPRFCVTNVWSHFCSSVWKTGYLCIMCWPLVTWSDMVVSIFDRFILTLFSFQFVIFFSVQFFAKGLNVWRGQMAVDISLWRWIMFSSPQCGALIFFGVCATSYLSLSAHCHTCTSNLMCWEYLQTRVRCSLHSCFFLCHCHPMKNMCLFAVRSAQNTICNEDSGGVRQPNHNEVLNLGQRHWTHAVTNCNLLNWNNQNLHFHWKNTC